MPAHDIEQDTDLARLVAGRIGLKIGFERVDRLTQKLGLNAKHPQVTQLGGFIPVESDQSALDGKNGRNVLRVPVNRFEVLEHPRHHDRDRTGRRQGIGQNDRLLSDLRKPLFASLASVDGPRVKRIDKPCAFFSSTGA